MRTPPFAGTLLVLSGLLCCLGCSKSPQEAGAPATAAVKATAAPAPAAPSWTLQEVAIPKRGDTGEAKLGVSFAPKLPARVSETNAAVRRAWSWAKTLRPHPVALRAERNMSGKKHFVEYLALLRLIAAWPGTPDLQAPALARAREVLAWTEEPGYHDMETVSDHRFRNESMSYLRAALLAAEFGWDTAPYRARIQRLRERYLHHLPMRGVDQQMSFAVLLPQVGIQGAAPREQLYPRSRIAQLTPFKHWVAHPKQVYEFTHEVFAMTGRGARAFPFKRPIEGKYARKVAHTLLHIHMTEKNHDGVAELLVNRVLLGDAADAQVPVARRFLLAGQDPQGRFGVYDEAEVRKAFNRPKYDVSIGGHLHTTMVALWALMLTS